MLITFEGFDGSGKSTQAELLYKALFDHDALLLREPGSTAVGEAIRNLLENYKVTPTTQALLYNAARAELVQRVIVPALDQNRVVIMDRFFDSTIAYQGYGQNMNISRLRMLEPLVKGDVFPTITFFLDIDFRTAQLRDPLVNDESFFNRVREGYFEMIQREKRFIRIDGSLPVDRIHESIIALVKEWINGKKES